MLPRPDRAQCARLHRDDYQAEGVVSGTKAYLVLSQGFVAVLQRGTGAPGPGLAHRLLFPLDPLSVE